MRRSYERMSIRHTNNRRRLSRWRLIHDDFILLIDLSPDQETRVSLNSTGNKHADTIRNRLITPNQSTIHAFADFTNSVRQHSRNRIWKEREKNNNIININAVRSIESDLFGRFFGCFKRSSGRRQRWLAGDSKINRSIKIVALIMMIMLILLHLMCLILMIVVCDSSCCSGLMKTCRMRALLIKHSFEWLDSTRILILRLRGRHNILSNCDIR